MPTAAGFGIAHASMAGVPEPEIQLQTHATYTLKVTLQGLYKWSKRSPFGFIQLELPRRSRMHSMYHAKRRHRGRR